MHASDSQKSENRVQEVASITRDLKCMAKELDVPVLALSQLRRPDKGEKKSPQLYDLRESGAIEQDADLVMFIDRPDVGLSDERITISVKFPLPTFPKKIPRRPYYRKALHAQLESGAIEQDADLVMFIDRPDVGLSDEEIQQKQIVKGTAYLTIAKNRHGGLDKIPLRFKGGLTKFVNPEMNEEIEARAERK